MQPNAILIVLLAVLGTAVLGGAGGYWAVRTSLAGDLQKVALTTPVFILDRTPLMKNLPTDASPEAISKAMSAWKEQANQLAKAGYLVIDSGMVVAAPEDLYVRPQP
jgi:hypothetical protein